MKKAIKLLLALVIAGLVVGCTSKPTKTIENLKYAYNGESTAMQKYNDFADKARDEGFDTVAVMFMAISKAEYIHAGNHKKVLEKLGVKAGDPQLMNYEVKSTLENLVAAEAGETGEIESMYPGFIEVAQKEKCADAVKSFTWALDTEKKHRDFFKAAIVEIKTGKEKNLPSPWYVCPVCGNTYNITLVPAACDFCMTPKDKFVVF